MTKYFLLFLLLIGQVSFVLAQSDDSSAELKKLKSELANAQHDTARLKAYTNIGIFYLTVNADSSLHYSLKGKQIADKNPTYAETPRLWNLLANAFVRVDPSLNQRQGTTQGEYYYRKSMESAKRLNNTDMFYKAWYNLCVYYSDSDSTYLFSTSALKLLKSLKSKSKFTSVDSIIVTKIYHNFCMVLDFDMSSSQFQKYLTAYGKFVKTGTKDYVNFRVLKFEQDARIWKKSDEGAYLNEYVTLKKDLSNFKLRSLEIDIYVAEYYFNLKEYKKAFDISTKAKTYIENQQSNTWTLAGLRHMMRGKCAFMLQENELAISELKQALSYMSQANNSMGYEKYTCLLYLHQAYKKDGNYKLAYSYLTQATEIHKLLHNIQVNSLMAEADIQVEEIKQDQKLHQAQTKALLKEQEMKIVERQKNILIILFIVFLLSTVWAVNNYLKKKKLSEILTQQNLLISQQSAALQESNQLKDKIFSLLSHDLRAPLNRLIASSNIPTENLRYFIQSELKGVHDILNNVLYWASMQLKGITPIYTSIPLKLLVDSLIEEYRYIIAEKDITFLNAIDKSYTIKTDENYLKIVLRNLISNAIKFTPDKGFIQLDYKIKDNRVNIVLRDTGLGIDSQEIDRLFQFPVSRPGTKKEQGMGLGLGLSLDIVKKLSGDIRIQSQQGKGTHVTVSLPV
ncbi:hypothetical protein GCM10028807_00340 [Spirosoma daeguense]